MLTVGMDVGKYKTKVAWKGGVYGHLSRIATYREIRDTVKLDDNNIVLEYEGKKYLAANLAEDEGQNFLNSPDIYKSNMVTLLNLMIGLSKINTSDVNLVIGNPFGINNQKERENLKKLIVGTKEFHVNGKRHFVRIHELGIAPEGAAAWYSSPKHDDCNIFDFGSSTIHCIAIRKRRLNDKRSFTLNYGFENLIDNNLEGLMQSIKSQMEKRWDDGSNKKIICVGGKAPEMYKYVRDFYPDSNAVVHDNHEFANALGLYQLGCVAYGRN